MGKKKWKLPSDWGKYVPDSDEKGFSPMMRDFEKNISEKIKKDFKRIKK